MAIIVIRFFEMDIVKHWQRLYLFILLLFFFNILKSQPDIDTYRFIGINNKNKFLQSINLSEISEDIKYIKLETKSDDDLIAHIDRLVFYKNKIIILDKLTKSIFMFDKNGKLLRKICKIGKGPGEYFYPNDITIDSKNDCIILQDKNSASVNFYNFNGNFIKTWKIGVYFRAFQYIYPDKLAVFSHSTYNYLNDYGELPYNLLVFNTKSKRLISKQFKNKASKYGDGIVVYGLQSHFSNVNDNIFLFWRFNDTIYRIEKNNIAKPYWIFDFSPHTADFNSYKDNDEIYKDIANGKIWTIKSPIYLTNGFIMFNFDAGPISKDWKKNLYYFLYSINIDKEIIFHNLINDIDDGIFNIPIATFDNYFVSVVYPEELLENNNKKKVHLTGISEKISPCDNPILFLIKFKSSF